MEHWRLLHYQATSLVRHVPCRLDETNGRRNTTLTANIPHTLVSLRPGPSPSKTELACPSNAAALTPQAYLTAWTFARSHNIKPNPDATSGSQTETQKPLDKFIDNWTNDGFVGFVNECEEVVDGLGIEVGSELGERCEQVSSSPDAGGGVGLSGPLGGLERLERFELGQSAHFTVQVFRQVLWLEQRFWPAVELA
jgi:hypothetical protein